MNCNHGGHLEHIEAWFALSNICPVPSCACHCAQVAQRLPQRICELHAVASFSVRLREATAPFQLLHFGQTGLPGHSLVEAIPPP